MSCRPHRHRQPHIWPQQVSRCSIFPSYVDSLDRGDNHSVLVNLEDVVLKTPDASGIGGSEGASVQLLSSLKRERLEAGQHSD